MYTYAIIIDKSIKRRLRQGHINTIVTASMGIFRYEKKNKK